MTQIHSHSFENIINTFGFRNEDEYSAWLKEKPTLPCDAGLIDALISNSLSKHDNITPEQTQEIKDIFSASLTPDTITGGLGKEWNEFFLKTAQLHTQHHALYPTNIVELDFSNMGGANNAIGREPVNRSVAIMAKIYRDTLEENGASLTSIRTGGDELRFYVSGIGQERIENAIDTAQNKIAQFTQQLGTDTLEHTKYKGNPIRSGFGVGAASITLSTTHSQTPKEIQAVLDHGIDAHKETIGRARDICASQLLTANQLRKHVSREHVESTLSAWENHLNINAQSARPTPELLTLSQSSANSYASRKTKVELHTKDWPEQAQQLMLNGTDLFNALDPTTGLKATKALFEDLKFFQYEAAQKDNENQHPTITMFEVTNLRGLNKYRNHEEANKIIHDEVKKFKNKLTDYLPHESVSERLYSLGASRFCLITTNTDSETLNNIIFEQEKRQEHSLNIQSQIAALKAPHQTPTQDIPNPTKHTLNMNGNINHEKGLMVTHVSMPISTDKDITPKALVQILEDLSDIYGFRPEAVHGHNALNTVESGNVSLKMGHATPWWVGNSKTAPVEGKGIPEDIAKQAIAGIRIPRESLPQIISESSTFAHTPPNITELVGTTTKQIRPTKSATR